jgi:hypothetical protein
MKEQRMRDYGQGYLMILKVEITEGKCFITVDCKLEDLEELEGKIYFKIYDVEKKIAMLVGRGLYANKRSEVNDRVIFEVTVLDELEGLDGIYKGGLLVLFNESDGPDEPEKPKGEVGIIEKELLCKTISMEVPQDWVDGETVSTPMPDGRGNINVQPYDGMKVGDILHVDCDDHERTPLQCEFVFKRKLILSGMGKLEDLYEGNVIVISPPHAKAGSKMTVITPSGHQTHTYKVPKKCGKGVATFPVNIRVAGSEKAKLGLGLVVHEASRALSVSATVVEGSFAAIGLTVPGDAGEADTPHLKYSVQLRMLRLLNAYHYGIDDGPPGGVLRHNLEKIGVMEIAKHEGVDQGLLDKHKGDESKIIELIVEHMQKGILDEFNELHGYFERIFEKDAGDAEFIEIIEAKRTEIDAILRAEADKEGEALLRAIEEEEEEKEEEKAAKKASKKASKEASKEATQRAKGEAAAKKAKVEAGARAVALAMVSEPEPQPGQLVWGAQHMKTNSVSFPCAICTNIRSREKFSKKQWKLRKTGTSRCSDCLEAADYVRIAQQERLENLGPASEGSEGGVEPAPEPDQTEKSLCSICRESKPRTGFNKKQWNLGKQGTSWCKECTEEPASATEPASAGGATTKIEPELLARQPWPMQVMNQSVFLQVYRAMVGSNIRSNVFGEMVHLEHQSYGNTDQLYKGPPETVNKINWGEVDDPYYYVNIKDPTHFLIEMVAILFYIVPENWIIHGGALRALMTLINSSQTPPDFSEVNSSTSDIDITVSGVENIDTLKREFIALVASVNSNQDLVVITVNRTEPEVVNADNQDLINLTIFLSLTTRYDGGRKRPRPPITLDLTLDKTGEGVPSDCTVNNWSLCLSHDRSGWLFPHVVFNQPVDPNYAQLIHEHLSFNSKEILVLISPDQLETMFNRIASELMQEDDYEISLLSNLYHLLKLLVRGYTFATNHYLTLDRKILLEKLSELSRDKVIGYMNRDTQARKFITITSEQKMELRGE